MTMDASLNNVTGADSIELTVGPHPCFSREASRTFGRIHLPVAPACNIQCNFCNRKYDCVAESRPGVTSSVLSPESALARLEFVLEENRDITVVGIAGPGDPLANPYETLRTLRLVRNAHPDLSLCISTNGLMLEDMLRNLRKAGLSHVTVTINSFNPGIVSKIYSWVRYKDRKYFGFQAAEILIDRQRRALRALEGTSIPCKINIVLIPGINDKDMPVLVEDLKSYPAVTCVNIMPLIPVSGSEFEDKIAPSKQMLKAIKNEVEPLIPQIHHCCQCRSDAVGKLNCSSLGNSPEFISALTTYEQRAQSLSDGIRIGMKVAVAGTDRDKVNEHFGHASMFQIFEYTENGFEWKEARELRPFCCGAEGDPVEKISNVIHTISDCTVVICSRIGPGPRKALESAGFVLMEDSGDIPHILKKFK